METVRLRNIGKRSFSCDLLHEVYCRAFGKCGCATKEASSGSYDKTGARRMTTRIVNVPRAIIIPVGRASEELHQAVMSIPTVKQAIRDGRLAVESEKAEAAPASAPASVVPTKGRSRKRKRMA